MYTSWITSTEEKTSFQVWKTGSFFSSLLFFTFAPPQIPPPSLSLKEQQLYIVCYGLYCILCMWVIRNPAFHYGLPGTMGCGSPHHGEFLAQPTHLSIHLHLSTKSSTHSWRHATVQGGIWIATAYATYYFKMQQPINRMIAACKPPSNNQPNENTLQHPW